MEKSRDSASENVDNDLDSDAKKSIQSEVSESRVDDKSVIKFESCPHPLKVTGI